MLAKRQYQQDRQNIRAGNILFLRPETNFLLQAGDAPLHFTDFLVEGDCFAFPLVLHPDQAEPHLIHAMSLLEKQSTPFLPGTPSDALSAALTEFRSRIASRQTGCPSGSAPIHTLKRILDTRYMESLHLDGFAEELYVNKFKLVKEFKKQYGMPPIEYLLNRRIQEACRLLLETNKKIIEIGIMVGLSNPTYFTRAFKEKIGCTPLSYRKQHQ
ncbi:helix-turn-helix transcriptional regulator [Ethanoligenens harbinense]|nr:helix-turn-helix transcriptional regulator [Ethanoligenens harbinense]